MHGPISQRQPQHTASHYQHQPLGHELAGNASRRCAQRAADGDLAPAAFGTDHQQARNIHARNQQQQRRPTEQDEQDRTNVARNHFAQSHHIRAETSIGVGILFFQVLCDRFHPS